MNRYIIPITLTIRESLIVLNQITTVAQTLLVVNEQQILVGTLTDGDIRFHLCMMVLLYLTGILISEKLSVERTL